MNYREKSIGCEICRNGVIAPEDCGICSEECPIFGAKPDIVRAYLCTRNENELIEIYDKVKDDEKLRLLFEKYVDKKLLEERRK